MKSLESKLRQVRAEGAKALVPYFMAGVTPDWTDHVMAAAHAGATAIEIGLPFSDPMMDGVIIQEAALRSLNSGTTIEKVCGELADLDIDVPLVAMTYFNVFHHFGLERSLGSLREAGISGAIVPDLSYEESGEWRELSNQFDVANIFLVAPSTSTERAALLARETEGFCYASARMTVTGKDTLGGFSISVVENIRQASDVPVFVGIGISTPEQAASAAKASDGAIVGSALVQTILDGASPQQTEQFIASFRKVIDA